MRIPLVAGNWKMNGTADGAIALARGIVAGAGGPFLEQVDVAVCPPFVFLATVGGALADSGVALGAQTVSEHAAGAFTGEISPGMLRELGCRYVIVGHSERRRLLGETDARVAAKVRAVAGEGMTPIVCVGESLEERESGDTEEVVGRQLAAVLDAVGPDAVAGMVVAYEPVWAIGTGRTAAPEQAEAVHAFIRARLAERSPVAGEAVRILYGGSVKEDNAAGLFAMTDVDGGLIGGAALDAAEFLGICAAARARRG